MAKTISEDEKNLQLRRDWDEFYGTPLVNAIVKREGKPHDKVKKQISAIVNKNGNEYKKMDNILKRQSNDLITQSINTVLDLAKLVDGTAYDEKLKNTYTLIDEANKKIEKVFVGENFLKQNLKKVWTTFTETHLNKFLMIMDDGTLEKFKTDNTDGITDGIDPLLLLDEEFCNYSETKKESIVKDVIHLILSAVNMYKDIGTDENKKMLYDKIKEINNSKKLVDKALGSGWKFKVKSPDPILTGPQYISISGNKYSVSGSKNDDSSHEMNYDKNTKCWNKKVSGGATKSKKKRGPKSRPKSSTKSREKSRRY